MATTAKKKATTATAEKAEEKTVEKTKAAQNVEFSDAAQELLTAEQRKKLGSLKTVSAMIRYLDSEGFSKSEIANITGKRYQHVRNVLITPIKKPRG